MLEKFLLPVTLPLSLVFRVLVSLRNFFYERGIFRVKRVNVPVISIGNLTVGGTGKTPLTISVAKRLITGGKQVCVLTKGYGRSNKEPVIVQSGGASVDAEVAGDEPAMMLQRVRGLKIAVDSNRYKAARHAEKELTPDVFLLDDGFQHRKLHRDLDIVILDGTRPFHNGLLLPAGRLREPARSLSRADVVVITGPPEMENEVSGFIRPDAIICGGNKKPTDLIKGDGSESLSVDEMKDKVIAAFCGIGNPASFRKILIETGAQLDVFLPFGDHHTYSASDLIGIEKSFVTSDADLLVTTEKDQVRLPSDFRTRMNLIALRITFELTWNAGKFFKKLDDL